MNRDIFRAALVLWVLVAAFAPLAAVAATPEEEKRFVAAVRKAFEERKGAGLVEVTCWDRVSEKTRKGSEGMYGELVGQKDVVWEFKLVDADAKQEKPRVEDGVEHRANLPIVKQLDMTFRDKDGKRILGVIGFAVGEKDGKLMLLSSAPVK
jgi:hypothetical protein